jgi:zinc transport system ATP-binding protein
MTLFTFRDVDLGYDGNVAARNLNFEVAAGDYLCVTGENGSGKSTVIKGLLGLLKPQRGRIIRGEIQAGEIGYLPQQKQAQKDFPASVYEVVLSGRLNRLGLRPFYGRQDKKAADENIGRLRIGDLRNRCYRELSGGQQQRALLARSLCAASKLLVLDEPAAGLDPRAQAELYQLVNAINAETGLTVVMVSHDIPMTMQYASRILHLQNEQVFFGSPAEFAASGPGTLFLAGHGAAGGPNA